MKEAYQPLTAKHAVGFAAPHTWVASVSPVILGAALSVHLEGAFSPIMFLVLLAASVLMQSSVNTLNDYYDFVKGIDLAENSDDPSDAVLVYNRLNPAHVFLLGCMYLAAAGLLGVYVVYQAGIIPLVLGILGGGVIVAYSAGKFPISYLPLGELVSGFVMGGLITIAVFASFTRRAGPDILLLSVPLILAIGLIMLTNNTCDIERDSNVNKKTLPILVGRQRAQGLYWLSVTLWVLSSAVLCGIYFSKGILAFIAITLLSTPLLVRLCRKQKTPDNREWCLGSIIKANVVIGFAYLAAIITDLLLR